MRYVRLAIMGPTRADVITFMRTAEDLCETFMHDSEQALHSAGMNMGQIRVDDDSKVQIFSASSDRPKNAPKSIYWNMLVAGMDGCVFLVDSTRPQTFNEAQNFIKEISNLESLSIVIAADRQDLEDAIPVDEIRKQIVSTGELRIVSYIAKDRDSVRNVILNLAHTILDAKEN